MRKLKYHIASTVDGFIAHPDHTVDGFTNTGNHTDEYLEALKNDYDTVIMGRKTFDFGLQYGVTNPYPWLRQYVFSSSLQKKPDAAVEVISSDPIAFVQSLKLETGKSIYLCGGAQFASALINAGLIDELIFKINPVVFGTGIGLLPAIPKYLPLNLISTKTYSNGVVVLHYSMEIG